MSEEERNARLRERNHETRREHLVTHGFSVMIVGMSMLAGTRLKIDTSTGYVVAAGEHEPYNTPGLIGRLETNVAAGDFIRGDPQRGLWERTIGREP